MNFEHVNVLYALSALVIPVLVHLFGFRKYRKVLFSNVQFLKEINEQQASRTHLKERLILAARLLTLFFLVLAFARPYLSGRQQAAAAQQQAVSIFIDNSYSMQTLNREGSLLDEAKRRAKEIIKAYGPNDRFQLLTQDFEGRHQRLLAANEFNNAVDTIKLSAQSRTLHQIINRQQNLLAMQPQAAGAIYIISDFQRNIGGKQNRIEARYPVSLVKLDAATLPNVTVDSVVALSPTHRAGIQEKIAVKLHNYGDKTAQAISLKLFINGVQKALGSFTVSARSVQTDTLAFSGLLPGWQSAEIQLQDNPVTFDNQFWFTFNVQNQQPVLLINDTKNDVYLTAAFNTDAFFALNQMNSTNLNYSAFSKYSLIILSNIKSVSAGLSQQLKTYVLNGGNLIVFPADRADLLSYKNLLQPLNAARPEKQITGPTRVSSLNLHSPVFKGVFEMMPQNPDLPVVKKYYQLSATGSLAGHLMELPGREPFFTVVNSGKGRVYVSAVPLDEGYSNLPRHALLLPLMFRIALLSNHTGPLYYKTGEDEQVTLPQLEVNSRQMLHLVKGKQNFIPDVRQQNSNTDLFIADQISAPGIYQLKQRDSLLAAIAFNANRSESDLHYLSNAELNKILPGAAEILTPGNAPLQQSITDINKGLQLWKVCIILALIFMAAEILLIRLIRPFST